MKVIRDSLVAQCCLPLTQHLCQPAPLELSAKMALSFHHSPPATVTVLSDDADWPCLGHMCTPSAFTELESHGEKKARKGKRDIELKHVYENDNFY